MIAVSGIQRVLQQQPDYVGAVELESCIEQALSTLLDAIDETFGKPERELFGCPFLRHEAPRVGRTFA
jgi:hypothetical protein